MKIFFKAQKNGKMSEKHASLRQAIGGPDFFPKRSEMEKRKISASARMKRLGWSMIRAGGSFSRSRRENRLQIALCYPVSY